MATINCGTPFSDDVSCIIGNYLNACVKVSVTASVSDPGVRIPISFQYLREKINHGRYVGCLIPPSIENLLATRDSERAATARRAREAAPGPAIVRPVVPGVGQDGRASSYSAPPGKRQGGSDGNSCPNPRPIQSLRLLTRKNNRGVLRNVALTNLGDAVLCKLWHLGFSCFSKCVQKGSHTYPSRQWHTMLQQQWRRLSPPW